MSTYTDAVLAQLSPTAPAFFYRMGESSGNYADTGINGAPGVTPLTPIVNAGITRATSSIVPGDSALNSVTNIAEVQVAERAHNALLDQPNAPGTGLTLMAWVRPDRVETGGTQVIMSKANVFQLLLEETKVRFDIGATPLRSGNDLVTPGSPMFICGVYNSASGFQQFKIYLNGIERATAATVGAPPWATGATKIEVGGFSSFGSHGFYGAVQHLVIAYDTYLSATQVQTIYQVGAASLAEVAGAAANVFPWSRQILSSNVLRKRIIVTNTADQTVFLSLGSAATLGGGIPLRPGDAWESPKGGAGVYTGTIHAIHRGRGGAKQIAIEEE